MSPESQYKLLLEFLKRCRCKYLYLVGDIADFWFLRRNMVWPDEYYAIGRELMKIAKRGTKIIYTPGNHDDLFRPFCDHVLGNVVVCNHHIHISADNKKYLVVHGDEFDHITLNYNWLSRLGSLGYSLLTNLNGAVNYVREKFNLPYKSISATVKRKVKNWLEFVTRFEKNAVLMAKSKGVDGIICGHSHFPGIREQDGITYMNCGDWLDSCTCIVEDECGKFSIVNVNNVLGNLNHGKKSISI